MRQERLRQLLVKEMRRHLSSGNPPRVPEPGRLIWGFFIELSGRRSIGGGGPNPIGYPDIAAWAKLSAWPLRQHHVDMIRALDDAWLEHAYAKRPAGVKTLPQRSDQPLSPKLFDLAVR